MTDPADKMIQASRELRYAEEAVRAVIAAPGVSLSSQRAKDARKKLKEAKAAHKEAKKEFDAWHAETRRQLAADIKRLDEAINKGKKAGKTMKGGRRDSRRTRRRV